MYLIKLSQGLLDDNSKFIHQDLWTNSNKMQTVPDGAIYECNFCMLKTTLEDEWKFSIHRWKKTKRRGHLVLEQKGSSDNEEQEERLILPLVFGGHWRASEALQGEYITHQPCPLLGVNDSLIFFNAESKWFCFSKE
jgi:hypothetical protein